MSLKALELKKEVSWLRKEVVNHHLSRPLLYTDNALFFYLSGASYKRLSLVLADDDPRIYLAPEFLDGGALASPFYEQIRKELNNSYVSELETLNGDRVVRLTAEIINSVFKEETRYLYFELIPHHANLILTDGEDNVIGAYRPGTMEDERPFLKGLKYTLPVKKEFLNEDKPFDPLAYNDDCLAKETELAAKRKKDRFGYLFEGLNKKKKLLERKIGAICGDITQAEGHLHDGDYADFIFMNLASIEPKAKAMDYHGEMIPLDPSRSPSMNAQLFYKRAKKARATIALGEKNLLEAKAALEQTASSLALLSEADEEGLETLSKEWGLVPQKKPGERKKVSLENPRLSRDSLPYVIDFHGTKILFGKSAKQNDCLTFLLDTAKNHLWFHVNGATGSHVMIKKERPTKEEIALACEIALLNSSLSEGEVMMCPRGQVRKGRVPGQALVSKFQMIRLSKVSPEAKEYLRNAQKVTL
jgi:predicted ribosome quality control (RQC) complex YloA/Tae2 family protein